MNKLITFLLVVAFLSLTCSAFAEESDRVIKKDFKVLPDPNWSILLGTPLKTTKDENKQVGVFKAESGRSKALNYAWATGAVLDDTCMVIIWIRGEYEDTRIVYEAKKENNLCTVYISNSDFESHFKYCVFLGISTESDKGFKASFGGGPVGDRDQYWFEWGDPSCVTPQFYCTLK